MERAELTALIRATGCAGERGGFTFLGDPGWTAVDRAEIDARLGSEMQHLKADNALGWLCIPTGGTGGGIRFARHDERTLTAAAEGFRAHFGLARVNAVGVLPAHHVSGLMARVRCAATGGEHVAWDWKRLAAGDWPALNPAAGPWVISLVPTQLQRLRAVPGAIAWLRGFQTVCIGGGPLWPDLAEAAAQAGLPVSLGYGMTETAAMVTASLPADFLAGDRSSGTPLPHARVTVDAEGVVTVAGESVFRGYFPEFRPGREFATDDLGHVDAQGRLHVLGRRDAVIITGGKKVQPAEVEAALRAAGGFEDIAVVGLPHAEWGEEVVACHPAGRTPEPAGLAAALAPLAAFKRPKRYVALATWPRNAQGKLNRAALAAAAAGQGKVES